ncbi:HTH-type transcriptional activator IlvY [Thaumasiovibrio subtropicus]|uniref:HTH-type transcriptional activator IlvY n=1 Tax=Thaumasiovibrio subtropicus TaxID=1891207 RepID=UPI000B350627|nr:HTH-type transcriptional activator IlvY [Thaumasiovibrio subtropicus]
MNLKNLQLFVHLCDSKSFNQTAQQNHVSPSTLSRIIQRLEGDVGQTLFIRDNRSVELTMVAKKMYPLAVNMLSEWQHLRQITQDDDTLLQGEIRMFCSVTASYSHLPTVLNQFRLNYPQIEIKLTTGDPAGAIDRVLNDEVDIAIAAQPDQIPSKLAFNTIGDVTMSVIAPTLSTQFSKQLQQPAASWRDVPFIVADSGTARDRAEQWFKQQKLKPAIYAQVEGHEAIVSMVALGCGIGIAPDVVIDNSPVKDKVERLKVASVSPMKLGLCCLKKRAAEPLLQAMLALVS